MTWHSGIGVRETGAVRERPARAANGQRTEQVVGTPGLAGPHHDPVPLPCTNLLDLFKHLEHAGNLHGGSSRWRDAPQLPTIKTSDSLRAAMNYRDRRTRPLMRIPTRSTAAVLILAALAACSDSIAPEPDPTVNGSWEGPLDSQTTLSLVLAQNAEGGVSGSGNWRVTGGSSIAVTVQSGTHVFPNLSLVLESPGYESFNLTGTVTASYITGKLNGSGFTNETIILAKR